MIDRLPTRSWTLVVVMLIGSVLAGALAGRVADLGVPAAIAACSLPAIPVLLARPVWAATLGIALLPFEPDLAPGALGGLNVAPSDGLLLICIAGLVMAFVRGRPLGRLSKLRPLVVPIGLYFSVAAIDVFVNPSTDGVTALLQRFELVVVALIAGACLLTRVEAVRALRLYLASSLVLTLMWTLGHGAPAVLAGQKNPAGQFLAAAALLSLVVVPGRWRYPLLAVFTVGVYATQSRGALVGLLLGLVVLVALGARHPAQLLGRTVLIAAVLLAGYLALPDSAQQRVRGETASTRYNDHIRALYATDAHRIIDTNPVLGIGPGNYLAGNVPELSLTQDPHNVVLLQAAEGGYPLLIAFGLLQLAAFGLAVQRRRRHPWAALAAAIQVATVVHALVDIYWVRGIPVMAWLLLGMVLSEPRTTSRPSTADPPRELSTVGT